MKEELIYEIQRGMNPFLDDENQSRLSKVLLNVFKDKKISQFEVKEFNPERNKELLNLFLESKKLDGCNIKSLNYYESNINKLLDSCNKNLRDITPKDIISYLVNFKQERKDNNPALFVSLKKPHRRVGVNGIETRLRQLGEKAGIKKVHPHRFRRTMATTCLKHGMPIEQIQVLLGHESIETTRIYTTVDQSEIKYGHMKYSRS